MYYNYHGWELLLAIYNFNFLRMKKIKHLAFVEKNNIGFII